MLYCSALLSLLFSCVYYYQPTPTQKVSLITKWSTLTSYLITFSLFGVEHIVLSGFLVSFLLKIAEKQLWEQWQWTKTVHVCKCLLEQRRDNSQWVCHFKELLLHTSNIDYWCFNVFWYRSSVASACYERANMACQSYVLQRWVVLEADLRVTADPCTLLDDDPMSTLEFRQSPSGKMRQRL